MARSAGSAMSATVGAASAIIFPNVSVGVMKNGGMKYRNARNPKVASTTTPTAAHLRNLFITGLL